MSKSPSEDYFRWLAPQIRDEESPVTYFDLLSLMYEKEFPQELANLVPHDENRLVDGLDLRVEFSHLIGRSRAQMMALGPCSFLEVLIGLSRRLAWQAGGEAPGWAWQLMGNLELTRLGDPLSRRRLKRADHILDVVMRRTYSPDGVGGFFPLAAPDDDQTQIEIWYQMAAYIAEIHPEH